ncbi:MAG TPA: lasso peptide biosynthesis B2 protein [Solirubrobacteraceae bacterium]|jgi:hypothetical protein
MPGQAPIIGAPDPSRPSAAHRPLRPPEKAALAGEILVVYARVRLLMRREDIRDVVAWIRARPASANPPAEAGARDALRTGARLSNAVTRTLRPLPTDTRCLSQALVLLWLLSRRGIPSTLVIGAHMAPVFEAHAWVELAGRPLLAPGNFSDDRLVEL